MNEPSPEPEGLTTAQIIALGLILFGAILGVLHFTGILALLWL